MRLIGRVMSYLLVTIVVTLVLVKTLIVRAHASDLEFGFISMIAVYYCAIAQIQSFRQDGYRFNNYALVPLAIFVSMGIVVLYDALFFAGGFPD